jgi:hypothetical protein
MKNWTDWRALGGVFGLDCARPSSVAMLQLATAHTDPLASQDLSRPLGWGRVLRRWWRVKTREREVSSVPADNAGTAPFCNNLNS